MEPLPFLTEIFARLQDSITPAKTKEDLEKCIHGVMSLIAHEIREIEEEDQADLPVSDRDAEDVDDSGWTTEHGQ